MQQHRHAIWPPSAKWRDGLLLSAPVAEFKRLFPEKVREMGPPLRVWDSQARPQDEPSDEAAA